MQHVFVWTPADIVGVLLLMLLVVLYGYIYVGLWLRRKGWCK